MLKIIVIFRFLFDLILFCRCGIILAKMRGKDEEMLKNKELGQIDSNPTRIIWPHVFCSPNEREKKGERKLTQQPSPRPKLNRPISTSLPFLYLSLFGLTPRPSTRHPPLLFFLADWPMFQPSFLILLIYLPQAWHMTWSSFSPPRLNPSSSSLPAQPRETDNKSMAVLLLA